MRGSENNIVVGLQWGNEGKGRIIDFLANRAGVVARFQGCSNGGRSVTAGGEKYRVCYLPCGIHHDGKKCLICSGVAIDLEKTAGEISMLKEAGVFKARLTISSSCALILSHHKKIDLLERSRYAPSYGFAHCEPGLAAAAAERHKYCGITAGDLLTPDRLREKLELSLSLNNELLVDVYGEKPLDAEAEFDKCMKSGEQLLPYIGEPISVVREAVRKNAGVLFEGCGGALNDANRGFYPCLSPLCTLSSAAAVGTGLTLSSAPRVIGVAKAYSTRMDDGPFVTSMDGAVAAFLRSRGGEFSDVTGESRRIGWLDLPALRYAAHENGAHLLALTKLDVLTGVDEIKVCTAYQVDGKTHEDVTDLTAQELMRAEPVYKTLPGWHADLPACTDFLSLPRETQDYIKLVEDATETTVIWVGIGGEWGNALFRING